MPEPSPLWISMPQAARGRSAPMLRHEFTLGPGVRSARLCICGLGYYEAWLNGRRVGENVLDPAQTDYELRCFTVTHEVLALLRPGANAIGVMLGDGFYNQDLVPAKHGWQGAAGSYGEPKLWAWLEVDSGPGARRVLVTDTSWKCAAGPVTASNVYAGEHYDARLEQPGWSEPGFSDEQWIPVAPAPAPGGTIEEQPLPPIRRIEEIRAVAMAEPEPGRFVFDMGQNFSGWARIRLQAPAGTTVTMRFTEAVFPDGRVDPASTGVFATTFVQTDVYTAAGRGVEVWEPRFTYHGFRYVEVTGWPGRPGPEDVVGVVVHTAFEPAGAFECSDERLNTLHRMALWTHRSNAHGLPEDCPARERCGWMGDANMVCEYSLWNFRSRSFWEKYLGDIETTRALNGGLPAMIAPGKRCTRGRGTPDWTTAFIHVPWYLYVHTGGREVLARHWAGMRELIESYRAKSTDWTLSGGLGDWCDPEKKCNPTYTPEAVTTTMWFWSSARVMAAAAGVLGLADDAARYAGWAEQIAAAFRARFYDRAAHSFGSQTADAMALCFGLAPEGEESLVAASLVRDIREKRGLHHTVGIMGLRFLFEALSKSGHGDVALALLHQDSYPSFGDLLRRGATTLWEYWGEPEVDAAEGPRSLNHPMMGGYDNWFFNTLAGIRPDEARPGFRHFTLQPLPPPGLEWVRAHHDSPLGRITSEWRIANKRFEWKVTVPPGSTATARLPFGGGTRELAAGEHAFSVECRKG